MTTMAPVVEGGIAHIRSAMDDVLDYWMDWSDVLEIGETIVQSTWWLPSGLTRGNSVVAGGKVGLWIGPATGIAEFFVHNTILTSAGRTYDRCFALDICASLA